MKNYDDWTLNLPSQGINGEIDTSKVINQSEFTQDQGELCLLSRIAFQLTNTNNIYAYFYSMQFNCQALKITKYNPERGREIMTNIFHPDKITNI